MALDVGTVTSVALTWQAIDLREDPDEARYVADPSDLIDALAELASLLKRPAWHAQAACRGAGPASWFPGRGDDVRPAQAVCATCPVAEPCAAAGEGETGIWGGMSERQRKHARRAAA
jgi:hypothetical protein